MGSCLPEELCSKMLHMATQRAWALMPKAAHKGGRGERCPLSFSAPILPPCVGMARD